MKNSRVSSVSEIFSHLSYDIIGRIIPGLIIIFFFLVLITGPVNFFNHYMVNMNSYKDISFQFILLTIFFSYIVSIFLKGIWNLFKNAGKQKHSKEEIKLITEMEDRIKLHYPHVGARLTRIHSEQNLAEVIITGFILQTIITAPIAYYKMLENMYKIITVIEYSFLAAFYILIIFALLSFKDNLERQELYCLKNHNEFYNRGEFSSIIEKKQ